MKNNHFNFGVVWAGKILSFFADREIGKLCRMLWLRGFFFSFFFFFLFFSFFFVEKVDPAYFAHGLVLSSMLPTSPTSVLTHPGNHI